MMGIVTDDLLAMATFVHVVESKSFTAAAKYLNVSKSVVSGRVSGLEQRLGVRLLQRTTRNLSLTAEGAHIYEQCARVMRAAEEAAASFEGAGGTPAGTLRVSMPATLHDTILTRSIVAFVRRYPRTRVELCVSNDLVNLVAQRVDVAIRVAPKLQGASLVARRLASAPKVVCASPSYLEARGTPVTVDELPEHACLRFTTLAQEHEWSFLPPHKLPATPLDGPLCSDVTESLRVGALAGLGLTVMPYYFVAADIIAGNLRTVLDAYPLEPLSVFAVHNYGSLVSPKVRAFVDLLAEELTSPRWPDPARDAARAPGGPPRPSPRRPRTA